MSLVFDTPRLAVIDRATSESTIHVEMNLDGTGATEISTGVPFWDHMLTALGKHSLIDLKIQASGDTHVDVHHTVEDTAICLGLGLKEALGDKRGIKRFGDATVPLDEALARAVVDVAGRPYIVHVSPHWRPLHRLHDEARPRIPYLQLRNLPAHERPQWARPASYCRSTVQGARPGSSQCC